MNFELTTVRKENEITLKTSLDYKKINSLFSNLSSLSFFELKKLRTSYVELGYSTDDLDIHTQKLYSHPFYMVIMTLLASIIMLNVKRNKPMIFYLILSIFLSVVIYYFYYLFNLIGESGKIPIYISIWLPLFLLTIFITIGLVRINEK